MFDKSNCENCEKIDCLTRCQWIEFANVEEAREEKNKLINGENSRVLSECVTCFACDEYCPYSSHPFDLITELQEKYNSLDINPTILENTIKQFAPHEQLRLKEIDSNKSVLNKCGFGKLNAQNMEGKLFENLQYVSGLDFFCNLMYHHYAKDSIIKQRAPIILSNIEKQGIKELICYHDECYGFYASYCPRNNITLPKDFKATHIYEYLYNYLKEHKSEINKLNMKIAYQRSCSNRFIPEVDEWADKIFELIGVERVSRKYDRENAMCCAGIFATLGKKPLMRKAQSENIEDMIEYGAKACVYNCPMCKESLGSKAERKGLKNYLLSDLCRLALGEEITY
ncbi:MAG: heterodisulfide reductase-related iron-sulfur binding cluster [Candidatus Thorarchaeota archaeon]